jgi:enoyl-CoA hydratase/carnithine racemase
VSIFYQKIVSKAIARSGVPEDTLSFYAAEERVFTAREALEYKFIDEIVRPWTPALGQQVVQRINEILDRDTRD